MPFCSTQLLDGSCRVLDARRSMTKLRCVALNKEMKCPDTRVFQGLFIAAIRRDASWRLLARLVVAVNAIRRGPERCAALRGQRTGQRECLRLRSGRGGIRCAGA